MDRPLNFSSKQQEYLETLLDALNKKHPDASDDQDIGLFQGRLVLINHPGTPYLNQRHQQNLCELLHLPMKTVTLGEFRRTVKKVEPKLYISTDPGTATASPPKIPQKPSDTAEKLSGLFNLPTGDVKILRRFFPNTQDYIKGQFALGLWRSCYQEVTPPPPARYFLLALNKHNMLDETNMQTLLTETAYKDPEHFKARMTPVLRLTFLIGSNLMPLSEEVEQQLTDESLWNEPALYARLDQLKCLKELKKDSTEIRIHDACFKLLLSDIDPELIKQEVSAISQESPVEEIVSVLNSIGQKKKPVGHFQPSFEESPEVAKEEAPDDNNLLCPLTNRRFKIGQLQHYNFYVKHISSIYPENVALIIPMPDSNQKTAAEWSERLKKDEALKKAFAQAKSSGELTEFPDLTAFIETLHQQYEAHWLPSELEKDIDKEITAYADHLRYEQKSLTSLSSLQSSAFQMVSKEKLREVMGGAMKAITRQWQEQIEDLPVDLDFSKDLHCILPDLAPEEHITLDESFTGFLALDQSGKAIPEVRKRPTQPLADPAPEQSRAVKLILREAMYDDPETKPGAHSSNISEKNQTTGQPKLDCYWLYSFPEGNIRLYKKFHRQMEAANINSALSAASQAKAVIIQLFPGDYQEPDRE